MTNSFIRRSALAATICAALITPIALGNPAVAAPSSASQHATGRAFSAPAVQAFTAGDRVTVSGTAAPGAKIHFMYLPGATADTTATTDAAGNWSITSPGTAGERFAVLASDGAHAERVTMLPTHETGDDVDILVDPIRFTPGERLYVTGTAAPNTELVITGIPKDTSQGAPVGLAGARVDGAGRFSVGGITVGEDVESFDVTFHLGGQNVTVTALPAGDDSAAAAAFVTTDEDGYTPGRTHMFTGSAKPGSTVTFAVGAWKITTVTANGEGVWSLKRAWGPTAVYDLTISGTGVDGDPVKESVRWAPAS